VIAGNIILPVGGSADNSLLSSAVDFVKHAYLVELLETPLLYFLKIGRYVF
jgi:hypothetical protein